MTSITLPAAFSGVSAAVLLGVGRAIGETMAATVMLAGVPRISEPLVNVFYGYETLTSLIARGYGSANGVHESALFAAGVVLFVTVLCLSLGSQYIEARMRRRLGVSNEPRHSDRPHPGRPHGVRGCRRDCGRTLRSHVRCRLGGAAGPCGDRRPRCWSRVVGGVRCTATRPRDVGSGGFGAASRFGYVDAAPQPSAGIVAAAAFTGIWFIVGAIVSGAVGLGTGGRLGVGIVLGDRVRDDRAPSRRYRIDGARRPSPASVGSRSSPASSAPDGSRCSSGTMRRCSATPSFLWSCCSPRW